jgi:hypothetical protein
MGRGRPIRHPRLPPLSLARQWASVQAVMPAAERLELNGRALRIGACLQPSPLAREYRVEIVYRRGDFPRVHVREPALVGRDGQAIPHLYEDGSLCLCRRRYGEWTAALPIGQTIVPWTSLWLGFYEIWLATDLWHGGGEHPPAGSGRQRRGKGR